MTNKEGKEAMTAEQVLDKHVSFVGLIQNPAVTHSNQVACIPKTQAIDAMESYALLKVAEKESVIQALKEGIIKGTDLYFNLSFDEEPSPKAKLESQLAEKDKEIERLKYDNQALKESALGEINFYKKQLSEVAESRKANAALELTKEISDFLYWINENTDLKNHDRDIETYTNRLLNISSQLNSVSGEITKICGVNCGCTQYCEVTYPKGKLK